MGNCCKKAQNVEKPNEVENKPAQPEAAAVVPEPVQEVEETTNAVSVTDEQEE